MPERPLGPAQWLQDVVRKMDEKPAEAPKVEEVKPEPVVEKLDPAAMPAKVEEPVKVEEVKPVPPVAEVAPENNAPASTVPPAVASPAPVTTPASTVPPVTSASPTQPLK